MTVYLRKEKKGTRTNTNGNRTYICTGEDKKPCSGYTVRREVSSEILAEQGRLRSKMLNLVDRFELSNECNVEVTEMCGSLRNLSTETSHLLRASHELIHSHPIRPPRSLCNDVRTLCWKFSLRSSRW
ncbi:eclosion hormone isoform X1 [Lasioglossum baleicum]|uniref:eclosion hormone isoform X1 n=1 Tax=Lasioglossum baleicum TaxID=434251 RepID=UPI003FCED141